MTPRPLTLPRALDTHARPALVGARVFERKLVAALAMGKVPVLLPRRFHSVASWRSLNPFRGYDLLKAHSAFDSRLDGAGLDASGSAEVSSPHPDAFHLNPQNPSGIEGLFLASGPFAVLRAVWAVIVDTVHRMERRGLLSHVGDKGPEIAPPTVADSNSAPAVPMVVCCSGAVATRFHVAPSGIKRMVFLVSHALNDRAGHNLCQRRGQNA